MELKKNSYTTKELIEILGVSVKTIYRWIKDGKIQSLNVGKKHIFLKEDLERFFIKFRKG
jgi:excisionase family DNA binding protein